MVLTHIVKNVGRGLGPDRFGHGRGSHHHGRDDGRETVPKQDHQDLIQTLFWIVCSFHVLP